ncbi:hypothetical protein ACIGO6_13890 [Streptomyces sp. NPDC053750]|uniref:hypothetical protein n=1 Tax=Streptomyces sp. NPDC053750 TaxID=3365714 RepID=UPI0037D4E086
MADGTAPTTTPSGTAAPPTSSSAGATALWAGTKQFVQIEDARTSDGKTYLSVRPAQKKAHAQFEAWVIVPGEGPCTEVPMAEDAKVLLSVPLGDEKHPASYSPSDFVTRLTAQPSSARPLLGYDLSFHGEGRVTDLGLNLGAGDENRTRALSLGSDSARAGSMARPAWIPGPEVIVRTGSHRRRAPGAESSVIRSEPRGALAARCAISNGILGV